jgi:cytochrome P450
MNTPDIDLTSPEFTANPYPAYARLRAAAPIQRVTLPGDRTVWLIAGYDDVVAALRDPRFVKNQRNTMTAEQLAEVPSIPDAFDILNQHMLALDPPDHTRLRTLVHKAFTPRLVEQLRPRIQTIADTLLDAVQPRGEMDLIDDYAFPLPITVIAELLGIPVEDHASFRRWTNILVSGDPSPERMQQIAATMQEFAAYLGQLFARRRAQPAEDLVSQLLRVEEAGDMLNEPELYSMVFLLLIAGHETTVNLIGNGMLALLLHPDQRERLQQTPALIESAIEEFLRYEGPVATTTQRFAREDVAIGGVVIRRGEEVLAVLASADHDERRFSDPDGLDITRSDNRHLAFGHGVHYCLGAPLARLEGQIAIGTLLRRMPNMRLGVAPEALAWRPGLLIRGLSGLPVRF